MNVRHARGSRDEAIGSAFAAVEAPDERNLAVELILEELLDRIDEVAGSNDVAALSAWLDDTYERHRGLRFLSVALDAAWRTVRAHDSSGREGSAIARIDAALEAAARKPRAPVIDALHDPLDEIDACLGSLLNRLFEHDPITAEHSRAVSSWCARIARKLGFSHAESLLVKRGGLAHDIGKLGTPDDILNAPRALTPEEWAIMRRHTADGAELVADLPLLAEFLPAIRSHHERLDGKGYPDGLRGEEIPLSARVVAVADCFNAMIGRRPYRPPMAPFRALEQLQRSAGRHLDPEIVEAMVAVVSGQQ